jgi:hypothetical protein
MVVIVALKHLRNTPGLLILQFPVENNVSVWFVALKRIIKAAI